MSKNKRTPPWKPEANDIIIPLMGPTGAGKSTFINLIAGKEVTTVGHDLKSCTTHLLPVVIDSLPSDFLKGRRLVLVDTPGFGDTYVDDADVLRSIGSWLETMYESQHSKLAGIVYLHDISLARMLGSTLKNLDVFQKLCGKGALKRVVLCTTKWSDIYPEEGAMRTKQLEDNYWKEMIEGGSTVHKFEDSQQSAWDVITSIMEEDRHEKMDALQIQEELVELHKLIPNTAAGQQLRYSLDQLLKSLKQASSKDPSRRKELDAQIAAIRDQLRVMSVPVTQRIWGLLKFQVDKILDKSMLLNATTPAPSTGNKLLGPAVGARLEADVKKLIILLGETETCERLLKLSAAEITNFGGDEQATTEVRCWSVKKGGSRPLFVVAAPSFRLHQSGDPTIFEKVRTWLRSSCREDMQFGIIFLHDSVYPPPSEVPHAGCALECVKQSGLQSNILFATFASQATGAVKYGFDSNVASFQGTSGHTTQEMFDTALGMPVELSLLLEELQTISVGATNRERKPLKSQLARSIIRLFEVPSATDKSQSGDTASKIGSKTLPETPSQSVGAPSPEPSQHNLRTSCDEASLVSTSDVRPASPPHGEKSPPQRTLSPKPRPSSSSCKEVHEKQKEPSIRHYNLSIRLPFGRRKKRQESLPPPVSSHLTPMDDDVEPVKN